MDSFCWAQYDIHALDTPPVLANAYFRVAIRTNASVLGLDSNDLADHFNTAITTPR